MIPNGLVRSPLTPCGQAEVLQLLRTQGWCGCTTPTPTHRMTTDGAGRQTRPHPISPPNHQPVFRFVLIMSGESDLMTRRFVSMFGC